MFPQICDSLILNVSFRHKRIGSFVRLMTQKKHEKSHTVFYVTRICPSTVAIYLFPFAICQLSIKVPADKLAMML